ncbi:MAG: hypothetical protein C0483_04795 [Pirellula sp.]|nr:hypothetical protein [Pirellula sp.]
MFYVAMLLNLQACRIYRSIIEECSRAEGVGAIILSRSLFETIAALKFVLARHVRIYTEPLVKNGVHKKDANGDLTYSVQCERRPSRKSPKPATPTPKKRLKSSHKFPSVEERAWFYVASQAFNEPRRYNKMIQLRGLKRVSKHTLKKLDDTLTTAYAKRIGDDWAYVLKKEKNYSGLKIYQLAEVLGKEFVLIYKSLYDIYCQVTHASDAVRHGDFDDDNQLRPKYFSDDGEIGGTLNAATAMILTSMTVCRDYFDFGLINNTMINGLGEEYRKRILVESRKPFDS